MAILQVLKYPDPKLKLVGEPVTTFDTALEACCADLFATMYEYDGVGLAAIQVNIQQQIFVVDLSENQSQGICFINPVITSKSGSITEHEGCVSFPGIFAKVTRSAEIMVEYYDIAGVQQKLNATGLLAICIQHEIDHLNGITFYDHLSPLKKKLLRSKLEKIERV